jgi:hypothetical protein
MSITEGIVTAAIKAGGHLFKEGLKDKKVWRATSTVLLVLAEAEISPTEEDDRQDWVLIESRKRSKPLRKMRIEKASELVKICEKVLRESGKRGVDIRIDIAHELLETNLKGG